MYPASCKYMMNSAASHLPKRSSVAVISFHYSWNRRQWMTRRSEHSTDSSYAHSEVTPLCRAYPVRRDPGDFCAECGEWRAVVEAMVFGVPRHRTFRGQ